MTKPTNPRPSTIKPPKIPLAAPSPLPPTPPEEPEREQFMTPTLTGWDPLTRIPGEPLAAYTTFRAWQRDWAHEPMDKAAIAMGRVPEELQALSTRWYWPERALAVSQQAALELTPRPWAVGARILSPLPPEAAEMARRREWTVAAELIDVAVDAIRDWRTSEKPPTLADLVKLLEAATRLARMSAGMPEGGAVVAQALNDGVIGALNDAITKVYASQAPESESQHAQ